MMRLLQSTSFSKTPRASRSLDSLDSSWPSMGNAAGNSWTDSTRAAKWSEELDSARALRQKQRNESVAFLVLGMSGWWTANAILAQIPTFVVDTPEQDEIANQLNFFLQLGNIFPFAYTALMKGSTQQRWLVVNILGCQLTAVVVAMVLAVSWRNTTHIYFGERSVPLLLCTFVAGGVGCMSNVTYWCLAVRYEGTHATKATSIGMTLGGLLSSLLAVAQNAGRNPRFSTESFLVLVATGQVVCLLATASIAGAAASKRERPGDAGSKPKPMPTDLEDALLEAQATTKEVDAPNEGVIAGEYAGVGEREAPEEVHHVSSWLFCAMILILYAATYSIPSLQPYMVKGYQNNDKLLQYSFFCQNAGDVAGRSATVMPWISVPTSGKLGCIAGIVVVMFVIFTTFAFLPFGAASVLPGGFGMIVPGAFLLYYFLRGFVVTLMYVRVKLSMAKSEAEALSSRMGALGQLGSLTANVALFLLISVLHVFGTTGADSNSASGINTGL